MSKKRNKNEVWVLTDEARPYIPTEVQLEQALAVLAENLEDVEANKSLVLYIIDRHGPMNDKDLSEKMQSIILDYTIKELVNKGILDVSFGKEIEYTLTEEGKKYAETL